MTFLSVMLVSLRRIQTCEGVIRTALPDGTLQIEVNNVLPKVRQCWLNGPRQHYNLYVHEMWMVNEAQEPKNYHFSFSFRPPIIRFLFPQKCMDWPRH